MNKVPGLTRQDDRPSVGGANRGRVQVRNPIGDVALRPQARPVDTYSRPQALPSGASGMEQLAGALAQVSPALTNFLDVTAAKSQKDAEDRAMRRIGGMSFQEARSAVDSGKMSEMDNPWFKAAFMKQYGERMAYERVNELSQAYETDFDKNGGDFDAFVRERTAADLEQYGQDPHFTGAYGKVIDNFGARANAAQAQYKTEQIKQDTVGGVYDVFHGQATELRASGKSPQEIVDALRGRYEGNRSLLQVDFKEQDKEMVRLAEAFAAKGDMPMVEAILNGERVAPDGTVLGPLAANREYQADAVRILNGAKRQNQEQNEENTRDQQMAFWDQARTGQLDRDELEAFHKGKPGAISEAQVKSLITMNDNFNQAQAEELAKAEHKATLQANSQNAEEAVISRNLEALKTGMLSYIDEVKVPTKTGEERTISVESQKKDLAKRIIDQAEWALANGKVTSEQAFGMEVEAFSVGNLIHPKWQQTFAAGPIAATQFTLSGGKIPTQLQDSVDNYMRLHAANPKLLDTHIKDATNRDFYEAYRIATQYGKMAPEQAMQTAMMQTSDPSKFQSAGTQQRFIEIDERVHDVAPSADNRGYVSNEIGRLGKFYAQNGMGTEAALDEARERFEASHTKIAGNYVYTAGKDMPPNFPDLATTAIEQYVKDFGEAEGVEADDLTIRPATNGNGWMIVHQTGQFPVENSARANLSLRSLWEVEQKRKADIAQGVIDAQARKQELNQKLRQGVRKYLHPETFQP